MRGVWRYAVGAMLVVVALHSPPRAHAGPVEFAYENQDADRLMVFFDMSRKVSMTARRDPASISGGEVDVIETCDYGRICLKLFGEDAPVIVPNDGVPVIVPGMTISTEPFDFRCCLPCSKTRVVASNGDSTENVYCPVVGIVSIKIQSKWANLDLFLKSWRGLGGALE